MRRREIRGAAHGPARVAVCHEWLVHRYGSEKTFLAMADALPAADLYALTWDRAGVSFGDRRVSTTFLDRMGPLRSRRDLQLPLMPLAWRYASRRTYDVVVTSSHACVKGFRPARSALHLCYCYTPLRYVWYSSLDHRRPGSPLTRLATKAMAGRLRSWDLASVAWVDDFAAISSAVRQRIEDVYHRSARVIHPPVDTDFYTPDAGAAKEDFALVVSRMIPYKRIDLVIRACRAVGCRLVVAGSGPDEQRLRELALDLGGEVSFVIAPPDDALRDLYRSARALVFPAEEDFGIVAVEAQACGTPVVALAAGGSLDTVRPGVTGVLVDHQDEAGMAAGLRQVLESPPDPTACRDHALSFSSDRFSSEFRAWVTELAAGRGIDMDAAGTAGATASVRR